MNPIPPVIPEFRRPPEAPPIPKDRGSDTPRAQTANRFEELLSKPKTTRLNADPKAGTTASGNPVTRITPREGGHEEHSSLGGSGFSDPGMVLSASAPSLATQEPEDEITPGDSATLSLSGDGMMTVDEWVVSGIPGSCGGEEERGEKKGNRGNADPSLGMVAHNAIHQNFEPISTVATSPADAVARISELCRMIGESASTVTLDSSGTATIELAQSQLPDSRVVIKVDQSSVRVTFLTDNPSSIAVLQARGAEVAGALSLRFDREISVELIDESEAGGESASSLGSWAVARSAFSEQAGEGGDAGSGTPS